MRTAYATNLLNLLNPFASNFYRAALYASVVFVIVMPSVCLSVSQPLYNATLDDVALLQIAVLQQDLLEETWRRSEKERGGENPEDIRPVHG